jgi:hypothetical protein
MLYPVRLTTGKVRVMLFKGSFNNISDILWKSVLLVEGTEVHIENYHPASWQKSQVGVWEPPSPLDGDA